MRSAAAFALLVLAGCGGGTGGDDLPRAVESFERRLEASRGALHVVTDEIRVAHEDGLPDLPPLSRSHEIWLDLGEQPELLMSRGRASTIVDPVRLVREGRLRVAAETRLRGREAYIVLVEPDPSTGTRLYVAADDGDLLRITHRRERAGRVRMLIQDYLVYEAGVQRPRSIAELVRRF
jgi:hypothetical protein